MSAHGLPGAAEAAVQPGLQAAHRIPVGPKEAGRPALSAGTSGSGNAVRLFLYRDLGSATCISCGRAGASAGRMHSGGLAWPPG
jgi:hypothetical protein